MCIELNIINVNGALSQWQVIKRFIVADGSGYRVREHTKTIDRNRTRVSTISFREDIE